METVETFLNRQRRLLSENKLKEVAAQLKAYCYEISDNSKFRNDIDVIIYDLGLISPNSPVVDLKRQRIKASLKDLLDNISSSTTGNKRIDTEGQSVKKIAQDVLDTLTLQTDGKSVRAAIQASSGNFRLFLVLGFILLFAGGGFYFLQIPPPPPPVNCDCDKVEKKLATYEEKLNEIDLDLDAISYQLKQSGLSNEDKIIIREDRRRLERERNEVEGDAIVRLTRMLKKCSTINCADELKKY